jgi:hypothetical protein
MRQSKTALKIKQFFLLSIYGIKPDPAKSMPRTVNGIPVYLDNVSYISHPDYWYRYHSTKGRRIRTMTGTTQRMVGGLEQ